MLAHENADVFPTLPALLLVVQSAFPGLPLTQ